MDSRKRWLVADDGMGRRPLLRRELARQFPRDGARFAPTGQEEVHRRRGQSPRHSRWRPYSGSQDRRPRLSQSVLRAYDGQVISPAGDNWTGIVDGPLPVAEASEWIVLPSCGAAVVFSGTARDHSSGRPDVNRLEYEAYEEQVVPRLDALVAATRSRWPDIGRMALIHRIGHVPVTESAVIVAVSSPHRDTSFEAARYGIDTLKATVPIWKKERWDGGESWGLEPQHLEEIAAAEADPTS